MSKNNILLKLNLLLFLIIFVKTESSESSELTSFDSLIASQCVSRCLSYYPWKFPKNSQTNDNASTNNDRKQRSNLLRSKRAVISNMLNNSSEDSNQHSKHPPHNVKWHKVMEMCSKNPNCLQCSLPCDVPTNLLPSCKHLCKNQNPLCIESCNLLNKLNEEKYGSCIDTEFPTYKLPHQCSNSSFETSRVRALKYNNENLQLKENTLNECSKDSECVDIRKCCLLNSKCPEQGKVCLKPHIINQNLPSVPFNLKIVERKKGKTIILSWDCNYNKNKPTLFVVEGRWSLKQPQTENFSDSYMTKWGYLAQSANNNWIILRNINRGRWYKFRVAAVSKIGTNGYSNSTELFILSSAPKPPSEPQNLTILQMYSDNNISTESNSQLENYINIDVGWLPPRRSDLPILDYRITWKRKIQATDEFRKQNQDIRKNQHRNKNSAIEYDSEEDLNAIYNLSADLNYLEKADYGTDLINAQNSNKYTIKKLLRHSNYSIELVATSKYDKEILISNAQRIFFDTNNIYTNPNKPTSFLLSETVFDKHSSIEKDPNLSKNDNINFDDDEDDEDEDEDLEKNSVHRFQIHSSERNQRLIVDQQVIQNDLSQRPIIRNLSIQPPFFLNGLVKAKLSWQIEENNSKIQLKQPEEISINYITDRPMFTITWFAIKCIESKSMLLQKQLPTPITATTINTNFEIYELNYNCDYVVNVRLAYNKKTEKASSTLLSSSLNRSVPLQIASAQFKVPSCSQIKLIGRIRPICYTSKTKSDFVLNIDKENLETTRSILFSTITSTVTTKFTITSDKIKIPLSLPSVSKIHYKISKANLVDKLYAVEFSWSLPEFLNKNSFNGYQISIVPKAIPGIAFNRQNDEDEGSNFIGSVGAIVEKEKQSFIAKQLISSIKYIFQIQLIGLDNQSYGPASNLEFLINENDAFSHYQNFSYFNSNEQQYPTKNNISLYQNHHFTNYDSNKNSPFHFTSSKTNEATSSSSLSSSNLILNNSNSLLYFKSFKLGITLIFTYFLRTLILTNS